MVIDWILPFCFVAKQPHHSFISNVQACISLHVRKSRTRDCLACGIRDIFTFGILGFEIRNPESGIPLRIRIQNPSFTDKESGSTTWNPESTAVSVYPKWGEFVADKSLGLAYRTPVDAKP